MLFEKNVNEQKEAEVGELRKRLVLDGVILTQRRNDSMLMGSNPTTDSTYFMAWEEVKGAKNIF